MKHLCNYTMFIKLVSYLLTFLLFLRICSLIVNQTTLFVKLLSQYNHQREYDLYAMSTLCLNEEIRNAMGELNTRSCIEAEDRLLLNPTIAALKEVLDKTYLCGAETCSSYIKDALTFLFHDWKIGAVLSVLLILLFNCSGCFKYLGSKRGRGNGGTVCIRGIDSDLPFNNLPYPQQYYYSKGQAVITE